MAEEPRTDEVELHVSDYHLSEGAVSQDGKPNPREDFKGDDPYARMLRSWEARHPDARTRTLYWNGDMVDFHAIRYRGRFGADPTVQAALEKLETCLRGHRRFWKATRDWLRDPKHRLRIRLGNHDLELAWPEVQARVRQYLELLPDDDRLSFVVETLEDGVHVSHWDQFDPMNANPPPERFFITGKPDGKPTLAAVIVIFLTYGTALGLVTRRKDLTWTNIGLGLATLIAGLLVLGWIFRRFHYWWAKEQKFLNHPYGAILNASLGQRLKGISFVGTWIGRMQNHGAVWLLSFARDWRFALVAGPALLANIIWHRFFTDLLDHRRKARFMVTLKLVAGTWQDEDKLIEKGVRKIAAEHPDVRYVVGGHTHVPGVRDIKLEGGRNIIVYNTGTGIEQVRLQKPEVVCRTRFVRLEAFFRRIVHYWRERTWMALGLLAVHACVAAAPWIVRAVARVDLRGFGTAATLLAVTSLLMRQSYALYHGESLTDFTPLEKIKTGDGAVKVELLRYQTKTELFEPYL